MSTDKKRTSHEGRNEERVVEPTKPTAPRWGVGNPMQTPNFQWESATFFLPFGSRRSTLNKDSRLLRATSCPFVGNLICDHFWLMIVRLRSHRPEVRDTFNPPLVRHNTPRIDGFSHRFNLARPRWHSRPHRHSWRWRNRAVQSRAVD